MSSWLYRKPEDSSIQGACVLCKKNKQKAKGKGKYQALCSSCDKKRFNGRKKTTQQAREYNRPYIRHKGPLCIHCGFKPEHPCQLDVDHIDGNHFNNEVINLQTLCANCHRLKTHLTRK